MGLPLTKKILLIGGQDISQNKLNYKINQLLWQRHLILKLLIINHLFISKIIPKSNHHHLKIGYKGNLKFNIYIYIMYL